MKSCNSCGRWKTDAEFYRYTRRATGKTELSSECRDCKKHLVLERHREKRQWKSFVRQVMNRLRVAERYA